MIRVVVVDDSLTVRQHLRAVLERDPEFDVVGEAADGRAAVDLVGALRPDVITMDIVMPDTSGLAATEQIMAHHPTPILIVSSSFNRGEIFDTYSALAAGAVDAIEKPDGEDSTWDERFIAALRIVSKIKVITHPRGRLGALGRARGTSAPAVAAPAEAREPKTESERPRVVAIGASTGGPGAVVTVLRAISRDFPVPIVVIIHIDGRFANALAEWLASQTHHDVRFAQDDEPLAAGRVLIAPPDKHLTIVRGRAKLVDAPPRNHCRPSIDVLFDSLAVAYGARAAACLLTGMGRDGASGLLAMRLAGATTIAQDEATSVIYGMPREAVARGAVQRQLPIDEIGPAIEAMRGGAP
jgi:two-component system chemotaxis response regulator CheB